MEKSKQYTEDRRQRVVDLHKSGSFLGVISKTLIMPRASVKNIIRKHNTLGTVQTLQRSGRQRRKLNQTAEHRLVRTVQLNPWMTKKEMGQDLEASGSKVSLSTIKRFLHDHGLRGCRARKKPLLQDRHRKAILKYANEHLGSGGGSIMLWGCFAASGTGSLLKIDGTMKREDYLKILQLSLKRSAKNLNLSQN
ncbi:uncharacterized protein LOC121412930 [Lytechinus variegatus]|uniref:uncharacterized protein LOC121412930 n=1 Tax=Lytechinus variegatus TaxID=7654 RepID=UPI001BB11CB0|nr:uncharacterized protein LOC121412930 [Lytechinus variegatus]